jgi:circadian clock protein KaiC
VIARLRSGIERLDSILSGGLAADSINLVMGVPGSGKTILAQRYAFTNGTAERPALYISTVSEPLDKIVRFGQTLSFFDVASVGTRVINEDIGNDLVSGGLPVVSERIEQLLRERQPSVVVIDSFKALTPYAGDARTYRSFLHRLAGAASALRGASLWLGEYTRDEVPIAPEFAVADGVIALGTRVVGERSERILEVLKLRGSDYASGQHGYRLNSDGLDVFPRLADTGDQSAYTLGGERISTGIPVLDEMVSDGYWPGSTTLCAGPSGVGKTLLGLHFITQGAAQGERGVIASLQENPSQLERVAHAFSWRLDGLVEIMYRSPVGLQIDEWIYELLDTVERCNAKRALVDSLGDLQFVSVDTTRFREFMYSLTQRCSRSGVSLFMTSELPDLFAVGRLAENGVSQLSDNVLLLQYLRDAGAIRRTITVMKTRATRNAPEVREFTIGRNGIKLGEPIDSPPSVAAD